MRNLAVILLLALTAPALSACPGGGNARSGEAPRDVPGAEATTEPGLDFTKINVGLKNQTLDYIGDRATGLAGARQAGAIYFATADGATSSIYRRDLRDYTRTFIAKVDSLVSATLAASQDGKYLAYARRRLIGNYIDNPDITYPEMVALVCRLDARSGKEEELFDFRQPDWTPYRGDSFSPFLSADGQQVYALAYDLDRLMRSRQLGEWLAMEADYRERLKSMAEAERGELETTMRNLLTAPNILPLLKEQGVTPADSGEVTIAERDAMKKLYLSSVKPQGALLIWDGGASRLLPLKFAAGYEESYHFIVAAGGQTVILGAQDLAEDPVSPNVLFKVDLDSGVISKYTEYQGAPSTLQLDSSGQKLLLAYNPVDAAARQVKTETWIRTIPLDGSPATETKLPGDFMGYFDLSTDATTVAAQDRDNNDLYVIDVASGARKLLVMLQAEIAGIFLPESRDCVVYLDNGILYAVRIPNDPPASPDWKGPEYFDQFKQPFLDFFTAFGFKLPAEIEFAWEEKQGLGVHEVAAQVRNPSQPGALALARYSLDKQRIVSAWFPQGYPFPLASGANGGKADYYACRAKVEDAMDRLGWLNAETRQEYHPGPNPLYDAKTDSYVVIFRDGYWYGSGSSRTWVFSSEVTMRVRGADGTIVEMTLSEQEPVLDQSLKLSLEKAVYQIRNAGEQPIPEDAPVRFDTTDYRLTIAPKRVDSYGPAKYQAPVEGRLCYEIDAYIQPEDELIMTSLVDTETGEMLGQLDYQPSAIEPVRGGG